MNNYDPTDAASYRLTRAFILDPNIKHFPHNNAPKDLILTRMGIMNLDKIIDETRLEKFETITAATYDRKDDPDFWLMAQLDITVMLMNDVIDVAGNFLSDELEMSPFLRSELRHSKGRQTLDKLLGIWLYPNADKPLPDILTKTEAELLQIICHWLDNNPRRPRPFFWALQDMAMQILKKGVVIEEGRIRALARYIHIHRNDPPDFEKLAQI